MQETACHHSHANDCTKGHYQLCHWCAVGEISWDNGVNRKVWMFKIEESTRRAGLIRDPRTSSPRKGKLNGLV
ncbi:hypothetical protein LB504_008587 [Fusarium proliferatum]|nr:hypothetical protein LB504_008587 [Fusarium proliferatum]